MRSNLSHRTVRAAAIAVVLLVVGAGGALTSSRSRPVPDPAEHTPVRFERDQKLRLRLARRAEPLRNTSVGVGPETVISPPATSSLDLEDALLLNAPIFYAERSFVHAEGNSSTALGIYALDNVTSGSFNTAVGAGALTLTTTGGSNTAVGLAALEYNTVGGENTAVGDYALRLNVASGRNTAVGQYALNSNLGYDLKGTFYGANTAIGARAMVYNVDGTYNTSVGTESLHDNASGFRNTAVGSSALFNSTGDHNIALGEGAGLNLTSGDNNMMLGNDGETSESNTIRIGRNNVPVHTRAFIAGVRGVTTDNADAIEVLIDSAGQLGTVSSSRRYKREIQDMGSHSEALMELRPVTFKYRRPYADGSSPTEVGLVAEEVAEVMPDLVVTDESGEPETVKYRLLSVMLLNEVQKLRREVDALRAELDNAGG